MYPLPAPWTHVTGYPGSNPGGGTLGQPRTDDSPERRARAAQVQPAVRVRRRPRARRRSWAFRSVHDPGLANPLAPMTR